MINVKLSDLVKINDNTDYDELNIFYFGRFDLWNGFKSSDKPIVRPSVRVFYVGNKNEER